jgi:DNA-binding beta-propeller fold protein YncE
MPTEGMAGRVTLGSGDFLYEVVEDWGHLPDGWIYGDVAAVGVDSQDNVYVFNRGEHPMIVLDRDGNFIRSWGEGMFTRAHGIHVGPDDSLYCTDDGDHTVRKCTAAGKILLEIGIPKRPSPFMSGLPFHRCTHTALSPDNEIYISDGYGNARVHKYSPDGKHFMSWGEPGTGPGEFNVVHNICCDAEGWVYVADRENHRVQVFDRAGKYETHWSYLHRPCGLCMSTGSRPLCYIGELGSGLEINGQWPNIGPRVSIVSHEGNILARLGGVEGAGIGPTRFMSPHGIAVNSQGDIFVGELAYTSWRRKNPSEPIPSGLRSLRKLVRRMS